jgi:hypothetical protein
VRLRIREWLSRHGQILPASYALNGDLTAAQIAHAREAAVTIERVIETKEHAAPAVKELRHIEDELGGKSRIDDIPRNERWSVRESLIRYDQLRRGRGCAQRQLALRKGNAAHLPVFL